MRGGLKLRREKGMAKGEHQGRSTKNAKTRRCVRRGGKIDRKFGKVFRGRGGPGSSEKRET